MARGSQQDSQDPLSPTSQCTTCLPPSVGEGLHDGVAEEGLGGARAEGSEEEAASEAGERLARRGDEGEDELGRESVGVGEAGGYHQGMDLVDFAERLAFAEKDQRCPDMSRPCGMAT